MERRQVLQFVPEKMGNGSLFRQFSGQLSSDAVLGIFRKDFFR